MPRQNLLLKDFSNTGFRIGFKIRNDLPHGVICGSVAGLKCGDAEALGCCISCSNKGTRICGTRQKNVQGETPREKIVDGVENVAHFSTYFCADL